MNAPRFSGIGANQRPYAKTVEWLTPPSILDALGGWQSFDLDPCTPMIQPYPTARRRFTAAENGLLQDWGFGRVWLNPPYSTGVLGRWMRRMAAHNHGTALIFARTETDAFFRFVWDVATAILFIRGRLNFNTPAGTPAVRRDGKPQNAGGPSALVAYGRDDADILAGCAISGQFVALRLPKVVAGAMVATWDDLLADFFADRDGPVPLADIYRAFSAHPKSRGNPHYRDKLRQRLQEGGYRNIQRGLWEKTAC